MSQQLRNRAPGAMTGNNHEEQADDVLLKTSGSGLAANYMISASPSHHGAVYKLQVPLLFSVLPAFLQRIICSWSCLAFLAPKWKERYLIQIGNYVYRFKSPQSSTPKGAPIPLEQARVRIMSSNENGIEFVARPQSVQAVFCVSSFRKNHYYGATSRSEALLWIQSIEEGRQEATRRAMGHTQNMPYPKSWAYFDSLGSNLHKSKERVMAKMAENELREMEMTNFGDGGPAPRGYYG